MPGEYGSSNHLTFVGRYRPPHRTTASPKRSRARPGLRRARARSRRLDVECVTSLAHAASSVPVRIPSALEIGITRSTIAPRSQRATTIVVSTSRGRRTPVAGRRDPVRRVRGDDFGASRRGGRSAYRPPPQHPGLAASRHRCSCGAGALAHRLADPQSIEPIGVRGPLAGITARVGLPANSAHAAWPAVAEAFNAGASPGRDASCDRQVPRASGASASASVVERRRRAPAIMTFLLEASRRVAVVHRRARLPVNRQARSFADGSS